MESPELALDVDFDVFTAEEYPHLDTLRSFREKEKKMDVQSVLWSLMRL